MIALATPAASAVQDPVPIPDVCDRCQALVVEDDRVAHDARVYTPDLLLRQWRCLNGHSVLLWRSAAALPAPLWYLTCDTCGHPMLTRYDKARRHPGCQAEHERRRKRLAPPALTAPTETGFNDTRRR